jgi:hypothetical protein
MDRKTLLERLVAGFHLGGRSNERRHARLIGSTVGWPRRCRRGVKAHEP